MGKKEGCNKMSKKTHFVTAPSFYTLIQALSSLIRVDPRMRTAPIIVLTASGSCKNKADRNTATIGSI